MANYDPKKINVIVNGFYITGFGEDTMVVAERNTPRYSKTAGAKGDVTTNKSADDTGTIKLTLKASSPSNTILRGLFNTGLPFAVIIVDGNQTQNVSSGLMLLLSDSLPSGSSLQAHDHQIYQQTDRRTSLIQ